MSPTHLALKLTYEDTTRIVSIPRTPPPSLVDLFSLIEARFTLDVSPTALTYLDEDDDEITLSTEDELREWWQAATELAAATGEGAATPSPEPLKLNVIVDPTVEPPTRERSDEVKQLLENVEKALKADHSLARDLVEIVHGVRGHPRHGPPPFHPHLPPGWRHFPHPGRGRGGHCGRGGRGRGRGGHHGRRHGPPSDDESSGSEFGEPFPTHPAFEGHPPPPPPPAPGPPTVHWHFPMRGGLPVPPRPRFFDPRDIYRAVNDMHLTPPPPPPYPYDDLWYDVPFHHHGRVDRHRPGHGHRIDRERGPHRPPHAHGPPPPPPPPPPPGFGPGGDYDLPMFPGHFPRPPPPPPHPFHRPSFFARGPGGARGPPPPPPPPRPESDHEHDGPEQPRGRRRHHDHPRHGHHDAGRHGRRDQAEAADETGEEGEQDEFFERGGWEFAT